MFRQVQKKIFFIQINMIRATNFPPPHESKLGEGYLFSGTSDKKIYNFNKNFIIFLFVHSRKLALVSSSLVDQQQQLCNHYQFWTKSQRSLCLQFTDLIPKVAEGAEMAYGECR